MASISRRAAVTRLRPTGPSLLPLRAFSAAPPPQPSPPQPSTSSQSALAKDPPVSTSKRNRAPRVVGPAVFPVPVDPFTAEQELARQPPKYSERHRKIVRGIARMMGYNTKAVTAIRETSRMMRGIVEAVEADREFWYDECRLPPTYQTFFQLHLLYVLILLPRLRALPSEIPRHSHPIPEPVDPSQPTHSSTTDATSASTSTSSTPPAASSETRSPVGLLTRPLYESYPSELLNHFFEMAESQMRRVLGRGERERIVQNYMKEMGEQWRGAGTGLDYVIGLSFSEELENRQKADMELASWLWRNLFGAKGLGAPAPGLVDPSINDTFGQKELELPEHLEKTMRFVRNEMVRLDGVSQRDVIDGNIGRWGSVAEAQEAQEAQETSEEL